MITKKKPSPAGAKLKSGKSGKAYNTEAVAAGVVQSGSGKSGRATYDHNDDGWWNGDGAAKASKSTHMSLTLSEPETTTHPAGTRPRTSFDTCAQCRSVDFPNDTVVVGAVSSVQIDLWRSALFFGRS